MFRRDARKGIIGLYVLGNIFDYIPNSDRMRVWQELTDAFYEIEDPLAFFKFVHYTSLLTF
jgi:hypothetical protein